MPTMEDNSPEICHQSDEGNAINGRDHVEKKTTAAVSRNGKQSKSHVCEICDAVFTTKSNLTRHSTIHSTGRTARAEKHKFKCGTCLKDFSRVDSLKRHKLTHKNKKDKPAKCLRSSSRPHRPRVESCGKNQKSHPETPSSKTSSGAGKSEHRCDICFKSFSRSNNLKRHKLNHIKDQLTMPTYLRPRAMSRGMSQTLRINPRSSKTPSKSKRHGQKFVCELCSRKFTKKWSLKRHKAEIHGGKKRRPEGSSKSTHVCNICSKTYKSLFNLRMHHTFHKTNAKFPFRKLSTGLKRSRLRRGRNAFLCGVCGAIFREKNRYEYHQKVHAKRQREREEFVGRPFECDICDMNFGRKHHLKRHRDTHRHEKILVCVPCDQGFPTNFQLFLHKKSHINKSRVAHCGVCFRVFSSRYAYVRHCVSHLPERPQICPICGLLFSTRGILNRHQQQVHCEVRKYVCDVCGKAFKIPAHLEKHHLTHTKEKPFLCNVCGKTFKLKHALLKHSRVHRDEKAYLCSTCGKKFTSDSGLYIHQRSHSNERPFVCSMCGEAFKLKHHLKNHEGAHRNFRPFECPMCDKSFLLNHQLQNHMKTHLYEYDTVEK